MRSMRSALIYYIIGFGLSIILTFLAYIAVLYLKSDLSKTLLIGSILFIAFLQLFVQLVFFLHLGTEDPPKWNVIFFITTFIAITVVVVGSVWIMNNLNYNMTPQQMLQYIQGQSGF